METECKSKQLEFQALGRRSVVGSFDGGCITSDAGGVLLREVDERRNITSRFSKCFTDYRKPEKIEHTVLELVRQRTYGVSLGYEDLNDHDELRRDVLLAAIVGKEDPTGQDRERERDKGKALAGKSTLNRLELTPKDGFITYYKKITADGDAINRFFVDVFIDAHRKPPEEIIIDIDATDDPTHGMQEGRYFHGYYRNYCYLPLYIFCGDHLLLAKLRRSNVGAASGSAEELARIIGHIRGHWPSVRIIVRGDSDFSTEGLMSWCENNGVNYILGLQKNNRLLKKIRQQRERARRKYLRTNNRCRYFRGFRYRTLKSWSRSRRVVGKAEHLGKGSNPRFVVTNLSIEEYGTRELYEKLYCARGDMENRIKEQQLDLYSDRTSTAFMWSNQLRLWFSSVAYILTSELRRLGLKGTKMARAQCNTIRLKLFKIGALIKISVRRVWIMFAEGYPYEHLFRRVFENIRAAPG